MKLKEIFSPTALLAFLSKLLKFHPFTVGWIAAFTVWGILAIYKVVEGSTVISFCLTEGFFMSLAIDIWTDFLNKRRFYLISEVIAILIIAADCLITTDAGGFDVNSNFVGHVSLLTGLWVACFFVPFTGSKIISRTQTYSQIKHAALSAGLALVLFVAAVVFASIIRLLCNSYNYQFQELLMFLCGLVVPSIVFTGLQLRLSETAEESPVAFGGGFCKYVLLPVALVYVVFLYIYLFKIVIMWELPDGEITWMVTAQMVLVLVTLYGLRDYILKPGATEANISISNLAMRWLPLLMLPLLVLMTVGLIYRLNQYGITASRIYVCCFLIWAYCIDFYLIFKQQQSNLNLIAISFSVLFVAVSAIPGCNVTSITKNILRAEIMEAFKGQKLPLTLEQAKEVIAAMPENQAKNIASKIEYLDDYRDHSQIAGIINHDSRIWDFELLNDKTEAPASVYYKHNDGMEVPEGYSMFESTRIKASDYRIDTEVLIEEAAKENPAQINCYSNDSSRLAVITYAGVKLPTDSTEAEIVSLDAIVFYNK